MNIIRGEAYIELTPDEVVNFKQPIPFRFRVLKAAEKLADETERTVVVAGPDEELGTFNDARGWRGEGETLQVTHSVVKSSSKSGKEKLSCSCGKIITDGVLSGGWEWDVRQTKFIAAHGGGLVKNG